MIDAGHGPDTPGKRSPDGTLREFMFNGAVSNRLKEHLLADGFTVMFSHDNLRDVTLPERILFANKEKVDAFISIHANAYGTSWNDAHGIETYTSLRPSDTSMKMALCVQQALILRTGGKSRGVKRANFVVLSRTTMPAILVECGFMTNKKEAKLMKSTEYQQKCAEAIYFGLLSSLK